MKEKKCVYMGVFFFVFLYFFEKNEWGNVIM